MPISINGSGTITGVSVGGLPDGTVDADTLATDAVTETKLAANTVTEPKLGTDEAKGLVKAWALTSDAGSLLASFNFTSVVQSGASGEIYTYTFTNAMPDTNYMVVVTENDTTGGQNTAFKVVNKATTGFEASGLGVSGGSWVAQSGAHGLMVVAA